MTNVNHPIKNKRDIRVMGAGMGNIYPGAIVIADSHLSEGNPIPLNNVPRAKIEVYPSFFANNNDPETIDVSSSAAVHRATGQLLNKLFGSSKYEPASTMQFNEKVYASKYEMMLGMGIDASIFSGDININIGINKNEFTFVQDTSMKQDFFTIRLNDSYRSDLSKLFGSDVTWDTIKKYSTINGKLQPLAIITSVTYGRSVHYLKEYSSSSFRFDGSQKISVLGTDVSFKEKVVKSTKGSEGIIYSVGDGKAGGKLITASGGQDPKNSGQDPKNSGQDHKNESEAEAQARAAAQALEAEERARAAEAQAVRVALADTSQFGPDNQGIPVSYTIELISGPVTVAIDPVFDCNFIENTEFMVCPSNYIDVQVKSGVNPDRDVNAIVASGRYPKDLNDLKPLELSFNYKTFRLGQDENGNYIKKSVTDYGARFRFSHDWNAFQHCRLIMGPGEYLDGYVRMDMSVVTSKGRTRYVTDGLIDASSGFIKLIIDGAVYESPQAFITEDSPTKLLGHAGEKKDK